MDYGKYDNILAGESYDALSDLQQDTELPQSKTQQKTDKLAQKTTDKVNKLSGETISSDSMFKADKLIGLLDADTYSVESQDVNVRAALKNKGFYDAVELKHGDNTYDMIGKTKAELDAGVYGKSTLSMGLQRQQTADLINKEFGTNLNANTVTEQDMIDVGNMQQVQTLADLARTKADTERWQAPLIRNVEQTNLTGKNYKDEYGSLVNGDGKISLGVDITSADYGPIGNRGGGAVGNLAGENVTATNAADPLTNASLYWGNPNGNVTKSNIGTKEEILAELKANEFKNSGGDGILGRLTNTGSAVASMAASGFGGIADLGAEIIQKIGNATELDVLKSDGEGIWKDGELSDSTDDLFGLDTSYQQKGQKAAGLEYEEYKKTGDLVHIAKAAWEMFKVPENWGTSIGFLLGGGVVGGGVKGVRITNSARKLMKAEKAAGRVMTAKAAKAAVIESRNQVGRMKKLVTTLAERQPGLVGYAHNDLGDQRIEYKELYKKDMPEAQQAAAFGLNLIGYNMEYWMTAAQAKAGGIIKDYIVNSFKNSSKEVQKGFLSKIAEAGKAATIFVADTIGEAGQEAYQEASQGYGVDMGDKSLTESLIARKDDIAIAGISGVAGKAQFSVANLNNVKKVKEYITSRKQKKKLDDEISSVKTDAEAKPEAGQQYEDNYANINRYEGDGSELDEATKSVQYEEAIDKMLATGDFDNISAYQIADAYAGLEKVEKLTPLDNTEDITEIAEARIALADKVSNKIKNITDPEQYKEFAQMLKYGKLSESEKIMIGAQLVTDIESKYGTTNRFSKDYKEPVDNTEPENTNKNNTSSTTQTRNRYTDEEILEIFDDTEKVAPQTHEEDIDNIGNPPKTRNRFTENAEQEPTIETPKSVETATEQALNESITTEKVKDTTYRTATHTVGVSDRSITKMAKAIGIDAGKLKKAVISAVGNTRIRDMKKVGKKANDLQHKQYHGDNGMYPEFAKLRKALANSDTEAVKESKTNLENMSVKQQMELKSYDLEYDAMATEARTTILEGLEDAEISTKDALKIMIDSKKPAKSNFIIKGSDVVKDVKADLVKEGKITAEEAGVDADYMSTPLQVMQAKHESIIHLSELLDSVNITPPVVHSITVTLKEDMEVAKEKLTELSSAISKLQSKPKTTGNKSKLQVLKTSQKNWEEVITKGQNTFDKQQLEEDLLYATSKEQKVAIQAQIDAIGPTRRDKRVVATSEYGKATIDEYMDAEGGTQIDQVHINSLKEKIAKKAAESETERKLRENAEKANEGKAEEVEDLDKATEVDEVQKTTSRKDVKAKVEELQEIKEEKKAATIKANTLRQRYDNATGKTNAKLSQELGDAETAYNEFQATIEEAYRLIDIEKQKLKDNESVNTILKRLMNSGISPKEAYQELSKVLEGSKLAKEATIMNHIKLLYKKIGAGLSFLGKVVRYVKNKRTTKSTGFDKLEQEVKDQKSVIEAQIKNLESQINDKRKDQKDAITKTVTNIDEQNTKIALIKKIVKRRTNIKNNKHLSISKIRQNVKTLNERARTLQSELQNTGLVEGSTTSRIESKIEGGKITSDLKLYKELKKGDIKPELQNLNIWDHLDVKPSIVGALNTEELGQLLPESNEIFKNIVNMVRQNLENKLDRQMTKTKKLGDKDHIFSNDIETKLFNDPAFSVMLDKNGDLNEGLVNAMAIVIADFGANSLGKIMYKTPDDLVRMLDLNHEGEVTSAQKATFTRGGSFKKVVGYSLAKAVLSNMGMTMKEDMPKELADKFLQGIGQATLIAMEPNTGSTGLIQPLFETIIPLETYKNAMDGKTSDVVFDKGVSGVPMVKAVTITKTKKAQLKLLAKELKTELDLFGTHKNYKTRVTKNLDEKEYGVRGSWTSVPEEHQQTLRHLEANEYQVNEGIGIVLELAGNDIEQLKVDLGYKTEEKLTEMINSKMYSQDFIDSEISRNREVDTAVDELFELKEKIDNNEMDNSLYFEWFFSKNGRFFLDSAGINPQTEKKLHRWLVTSKDQEKDWDLNDESDLLHFKISAVQAFDGSDFGGGIDKMEKSSVEERFAQLVSLDDKDLLQEIKKADHLGHASLAVAGIRKMKENSKHSKSYKDKAKKIEQLKKEEGKEQEIKQAKEELKALLKETSYTPFKATMLIEYDAVTSGFILKLLQTPILDGDKLKKWIAKGGIFESDDKRVKDMLDTIGMADIIGNGGVVDAYKSQGHLLYEIATTDGGSTRLTLKDGKLVFNAGTKTIKKKTVKNDPKDLVRILQDSGLIESIFVLTEDGNLVMEDIGDGKQAPKMTAWGRALFKPGFMTFNYGSSMASIKKKIGEVLAEEVINKLTRSKIENGKLVMYDKKGKRVDSPPAFEELISVFDNNKTPLSTLLDETKAMSEEDIKKSIEDGTYGKTTKLRNFTSNYSAQSLVEVLQDVLSESYGEVITGAMKSEFKELTELNEAMINTTKVMFRLWQKEYLKEISKVDGLLTSEQDQVIMDKLAKKFPLIKAPLSQNDTDGVSISTSQLSSRTSTIIGQTQTNMEKDKNEGHATLKIQGMQRELAEAHAAGAVLPIHWIDGSVIGKVLGKYEGILGVHDAMVLGKNFLEAVQTMNKATIEIGRSYDMVGALMDSLMDSLDGVDQKEFEAEFDKETTVGNVIAEMIKQHDKVSEARKEFYSTNKISGNVSGHADTMYEMEANEKQETGIINKVSSKDIDIMNSELDKLIRECK